MPFSVGSVDHRVDTSDPTQLEEALRHSAERFRALVEATSQIVWTTDPTGLVTDDSPSWRAFTGQTFDEWKDFGWLDAVHPDDRAASEQAWRNAVAQRQPYQVVYRLQHVGGGYRQVLACGVPVLTQDGQIREWVGMNTDITDRMRHSEELAQLKEESDQRQRVYEAALSNTPDLIYVFDLQHRFLFANEALLSMWGRTWEDSIGKTCLELGYPPWHAEMHDREIDQVVATKGPVRGEVPFSGTNGRRIYEYIFSPVFDASGQVTAIAGSTRDVTDRQHAEQAIREQAAQLREADRRKDEFLATLGHELRNPLASIVNAAEAMTHSQGATGQAEMLAIVERQARHMSRLIDDLLDVARIARGKILLRAERLDFAQIVREAAEDHRREIQDGGLTMSVNVPDGPLWINGDKTRLSQVVGNLLHNAAKFTDPGGQVAISLVIEQGKAVLRVVDSGLGMSPEMLSRIFIPFNQADASLARSRGGLGLGLALVKGLVELHDGSVAAASGGLGDGSEFAVRLPLAASLQNPNSETAPDGNGLSSLRILAIDDRRDILRPMQVLLTREGHEVRIVTDGRAGFDEALQSQPDVVICDIGLPGEMNGYDVARALRAAPETASAYLVALTGYGQEHDRQSAAEAGFDLHLTKPIDIRVLRSVLANVTPRSQA